MNKRQRKKADWKRVQASHKRFIKTLDAMVSGPHPWSVTWNNEPREGAKSPISDD